MPLDGRRMGFSPSSKRSLLFVFRASVTTKRGNYAVFIFETLQATSLQKSATTPLGGSSIDTAWPRLPKV